MWLLFSHVLLIGKSSQSCCFNRTRRLLVLADSRFRRAAIKRWWCRPSPVSCADSHHPWSISQTVIPPVHLETRSSTASISLKMSWLAVRTACHRLPDAKHSILKPSALALALLGCGLVSGSLHEGCGDAPGVSHFAASHQKLSDLATRVTIRPAFDEIIARTLLQSR